MNLDSAVEQLRAAERGLREDPPVSIEDKESVLDEYQPLFQPEEIGSLAEQEFKEFLLYENNRHWTGLHRKRSMMTDDMEQLRKGLETLVDDN